MLVKTLNTIKLDLQTTLTQDLWVIRMTILIMAKQTKLWDLLIQRNLFNKTILSQSHPWWWLPGIPQASTSISIQAAAGTMVLEDFQVIKENSNHLCLWHSQIFSISLRVEKIWHKNDSLNLGNKHDEIGTELKNRLLRLNWIESTRLGFKRTF